MESSVILYSYFRSTAAYRVRIALNLKNIDYEIKPINLVLAEHKTSDYQKNNPFSLVPCLIDGQHHISQSMNILSYLEESYPTIPLLPEDIEGKSFSRSIAYSIACEVHPLNNLRVLKFLENDLSINDEKKMEWYHHWIQITFDVIEQKLLMNRSKSSFCYGDQPSWADICLIPQLFNARRFGFSLENYANILAVEQKCFELEAFKKAVPEHQPDYVS